MCRERTVRRTSVPIVAWVALLAAALPVRGADDKPPAPITAPEARAHVDETRTVEMTVRSTKNATGRREYYLDSEPDFRDERNLAVVISYDHADKFREAGISDPAEHFRDKTIQVTGKIIREAEQVRIRVEDPKQIKLVDETTP